MHQQAKRQDQDQPCQLAPGRLADLASLFVADHQQGIPFAPKTADFIFPVSSDIRCKGHTQNGIGHAIRYVSPLLCSDVFGHHGFVQPLAHLQIGAGHRAIDVMVDVDRANTLGTGCTGGKDCCSRDKQDMFQEMAPFSLGSNGAETMGEDL